MGVGVRHHTPGPIPSWVKPHGLFHSLDFSTESGQLFFDVLVTAIEMINAVYERRAFGDEAGKNQASAGPEIGRHDLGCG